MCLGGGVLPEKPYVPPYRINDKIVNLIAEINEYMGMSPHLRRENQIRSMRLITFYLHLIPSAYTIC